MIKLSDLIKYCKDNNLKDPEICIINEGEQKTYGSACWENQGSLELDHVLEGLTIRIADYEEDFLESSCPFDADGEETCESCQ